MQNRLDDKVWTNQEMAITWSLLPESDAGWGTAGLKSTLVLFLVIIVIEDDDSYLCPVRLLLQVIYRQARCSYRLVPQIYELQVVEYVTHIWQG